MESLLGTTLDVWIGVTLVLTGGASFMTGQAIARTWRPVWQVVAYGLLLAIVSRFFIYALFDGYMLDIFPLEAHLQVLDVESGEVMNLGVKGYSPSWVW